LKEVMYNKRQGKKKLSKKKVSELGDPLKQQLGEWRWTYIQLLAYLLGVFTSPGSFS
jgi:hypothetical protein